MRKYLFTISAQMEGQTVLNFYNFDSKLYLKEEDFVEAFKEFYTQSENVRVRAFREMGEEQLAIEAA